MSPYIIQAQLKINASSANVGPAINSIKKQFGNMNVGVPVQLHIPPSQIKQLLQMKGQLGQVGKSAQTAGRYMVGFSESVGISARRFASFGVAAAVLAKVSFQIRDATTAALEFDREMVRLQQVQKTTVSEINLISNTITKLGTQFGVSSADMAKTATTLRQAGLSARDTAKALDILGKTTLSPTFENLSSTTEGLIALFGSFGHNVHDLEKDFDAISRVSADFAVESTDLIEALKRTGGAFKQAGGNVHELLAMFTTIRSTTRESAASISTGMRTILARLQDPTIAKKLQEVGIQVYNLKGQFVGPLEAINRLGDALRKLPAGDIRASNIIKDIGGLRQLSRVIPLIYNPELTQKALRVAADSMGSLKNDAETAQKAILVQLSRVKEGFLDLFRVIAQDSAVRSTLGMMVNMVEGLVTLMRQLKPLVPVFLAFASFKALSGIGTSYKLFKKGLVAPVSGYAEGGPVRGGVPGKDSVPAMLMPNEYVFSKKAVDRIGLHNLDRLHRMARGGKIGHLDNEKDQVKHYHIISKYFNEKIHRKEFLSHRGALDRHQLFSSANQAIISGMDDPDINLLDEAMIQRTLIPSRVYRAEEKYITGFDPRKSSNIGKSYIHKTFIPTAIHHPGYTIHKRRGDAISIFDLPRGFRGAPLLNFNPEYSEEHELLLPRNIEWQLYGHEKGVPKFRPILPKQSLFKNKSPLLEGDDLKSLDERNLTLDDIYKVLRRGYARGGLIPKNISQRHMSENRRLLASILKGPGGRDIYRQIRGSTFLGSGAEALAFKSPHGTVFRLGSYKTQRPKDNLTLQPLNSRVVDHTLVEELPFATTLAKSNLSDDERQRALKNFEKRVKKQGLKPWDVSENNIGYITLKGRKKFLAIDPNTYIDESRPFLRSFTQRKANNILAGNEDKLFDMNNLFGNDSDTVPKFSSDDIFKFARGGKVDLASLFDMRRTNMFQSRRKRRAAQYSYPALYSFGHDTPQQFSDYLETAQQHHEKQMYRTRADYRLGTSPNYFSRRTIEHKRYLRDLINEHRQSYGYLSRANRRRIKTLANVEPLDMPVKNPFLMTGEYEYADATGDYEHKDVSGFARGGTVIPRDFPHARRRLSYILKEAGQHRKEIYDKVKGKPFVGAGANAVVFRSGDRDVLKVSPADSYRNLDRYTLQPTRTHIIGRHKVERFPYSPPLTETVKDVTSKPKQTISAGLFGDVEIAPQTRMQKIINAFNKRLVSEGYSPWDIKPANLTRYRGRILSLDEDAYRPFAEGGLIPRKGGWAKLAKSGRYYALEDFLVSGGRKQPMGSIGQRTRLRRVEVDPLTGELTPRARFYAKHRTERFLQRNQLLHRARGGRLTRSFSPSLEQLESRRLETGLSFNPTKKDIGFSALQKLVKVTFGMRPAQYIHAGKLMQGRKVRFARGGRTEALLNQVKQPINRKDIENIFNSKYGHVIKAILPDNSNYLTSGTTAHVFRSDNNVYRIQDGTNFGLTRPKDKYTLQPSLSIKIGDEDDGYLVEKLPYAPPIAHTISSLKRIRRIKDAFNKRLKREGKIGVDIHEYNLSRYKGKIVAIDPETYVDKNRKQFADGGVVPWVSSPSSMHKGTDTVPAILTPDEFVIRRDAAKKIGYDKLHFMNKTGKLPGYMHGGTVGKDLTMDVLREYLQHIGSDIDPEKYIKEIVYKEKLKQKGRFDIGKEHNRIVVGPKADIGTLLHELGHAIDFQQGKFLSDDPKHPHHSIASKYQSISGVDLRSLEGHAGLSAYKKEKHNRESFASSFASAALIKGLTKKELSENFAHLAQKKSEKGFRGLTQSVTNRMKRLNGNGIVLSNPTTSITQPSNLQTSTAKPDPLLHLAVGRNRMGKVRTTANANGLFEKEPPTIDFSDTQPKFSSTNRGYDVQNMGIPHIPVLNQTPHDYVPPRSYSAQLANSRIQNRQAAKTYQEEKRKVAMAHFGSGMHEMYGNDIGQLRFSEEDPRNLSPKKTYRYRLSGKSGYQHITSTSLGEANRVLASQGKLVKTIREVDSSFSRQLFPSMSKWLTGTTKEINGVQTKTGGLLNKLKGKGRSIGTTGLFAASMVLPQISEYALGTVREPGRFGRTGAKIGGAVSAALSGGASGAAIGSFFGPAGTAIGALAGAALSATGALGQMAEEVKQIRLEELEKALGNLQIDQKTNNLEGHSKQRFSEQFAKSVSQSIESEDTYINRFSRDFGNPANIFNSVTGNIGEAIGGGNFSFKDVGKSLYPLTPVSIAQSLNPLGSTHVLNRAQNTLNKEYKPENVNLSKILSEEEKEIFSKISRDLFVSKITQNPTKGFEEINKELGSFKTKGKDYTAKEILSLNPKYLTEITKLIPEISKQKELQDKMNSVMAQVNQGFELTVQELELFSKALQTSGEQYATRQHYMEMSGAPLRGEIMAAPSNLNIGSLGLPGSFTSNLHEFAKEGGGYDTARQELLHIVSQLGKENLATITPEDNLNIGLKASSMFRNAAGKPGGKYNEQISESLMSLGQIPNLKDSIAQGNAGAIVDQILSPFNQIKQHGLDANQNLNKVYAQKQQYHVVQLQREVEQTQRENEVAQNRAAIGAFLGGPARVSLPTAKITPPISIKTVKRDETETDKQKIDLVNKENLALTQRDIKNRVVVEQGRREAIRRNLHHYRKIRIIPSFYAAHREEKEIDYVLQYQKEHPQQKAKIPTRITRDIIEQKLNQGQKLSRRELGYAQRKRLQLRRPQRFAGTIAEDLNQNIIGGRTAEERQLDKNFFAQNRAFIEGQNKLAGTTGLEGVSPEELEKKYNSNRARQKELMAQHQKATQGLSTQDSEKYESIQKKITALEEMKQFHYERGHVEESQKLQGYITGHRKEAAEIEKKAGLGNIDKITNELNELDKSTVGVVAAMKNFAESTHAVEYAQKKYQIALDKYHADQQVREKDSEVLAFGSQSDKMQLAMRENITQQAVAMNPQQFAALPDQIKKIVYERLQETKGMNRTVQTFDKYGRFKGLRNIESQEAIQQMRQPYLNALNRSFGANALRANVEQKAVLKNDAEMRHNQINESFNNINKKDIGEQKVLNADNFQKYIEGINQGIADQMKATEAFLSGSAELTKALNNFPHKLQIERNGNINVNIMGGALIQNVKNDLEKGIMEQVITKLQDMVKKEIKKQPLQQ